MSEEFDPYQALSSIPPNERPANYYRLLELPLFESNSNVISSAADRKMTFVRMFQKGPYAQQAQQILNELAQARITLLDKRKKAEYDAKLRAEQNSGSNNETEIVSSLGSDGVNHSAPPPFTASQTPQPGSDNYQGTQSPTTSPRDNTVPPIPETPNSTDPFFKNNWIALLISLVAVQLFICGGGLLVFLKPGKTEFAQNAPVEPPQNVVDDAKDETQSSEAALAKLFYEQSVDLQEKEDYDEALNKINVAVELQPDNELYKTQQQALMRFVKTLRKSKKQPALVASEDQPEQSETDPVPNNDDKPASIQPDSEPEESDETSPARTSMTPEESKARHPEEERAKAENVYNEAVDLEEKEQYAEALVKIEDALAIDPNNEDFIKEKINIQTGYYKQYVLHRIKREYRPALEKIDKAIEFVPNEEFYKEEKQKTEELVKAVEEGKELPEKDPDYGDPVAAALEPVVKHKPEQPLGFEPGKEAGERKTVVIDGVEIAFRWCPPGTFMMGSPTSEAGRKDDEKQHEVELTKGFWIMETQITVGMFKAFVNDTGYKSKGLTPWGLSNGKWKQDAGYTWLNPGFAQGDNNPVTCISWQDAVAFSKWLGGKIESKTKLPTEAQWEYACRAGSKSAYFWGNALNGDRANCNGNYPYGTTVKGPNPQRPVPVRSYQPNAWGVYDMHGNVWEWCLDGYGAYSNGNVRWGFLEELKGDTDDSMGKVTDPLERGDGTNRVFRGGSWCFKAERCRSAFRGSDVPAIRLPNLGGRCVVEPGAKAPVPVANNLKRKAGDRIVKTINGVEFAFRWCPAGTFMMGSPKSEEGRDSEEKPHQVTLTKGFWMMETEVTQKQWKAIMGNNPSKIEGDNLPVEQVGGDCQKFCIKCTQLGLPIQLPTEAQWEYACRAGTTGAYAGDGDLVETAWGDLEKMAWYKSNSGYETHPVGTKKPNAWGLYDMHGNVWEWCVDSWKKYPGGSVTDPIVPASNHFRVIRGGSYCVGADRCRSASRGSSHINGNTNTDVGFRCVSSADFESSKTESVSNNDNNKESATPKVQGDISAGKKAGDRAVKVINGVEFAFRWCPAATFIMGSPESEEGHGNDEKQHKVTLTKGFWMLETEVTQKQWIAVMGNNPSYFKGDDLPVEKVSWDDCHEFCKKCVSLGLIVQLPTESQWEYACRAGTTGAYAMNLDEMAWYISNSRSKTHPVGTKKPNAWGLFDMHGNVYEWCQDGSVNNPDESVTDPVGTSNGPYRISRGGGWGSYARFCRSADRSRFGSYSQHNYLGFRCVSLTDLDFSAPVNTNFDTNDGKRAVKVINGVEFAFRWCPPGTFMMGAPTSEKDRFDNETQHQVTLTKGFWMLETEVTQKQWKAVMGSNPSNFKGDDLPVANVSWNDCQDFCKKCTILGLPALLPTEAQWEYACRAGTIGEYAGEREAMTWYYSISGSKTHPVGSKKSNAWGLYDMHGNVWEWCADFWKNDYPSGSVTDPTGPSHGDDRVNRGGSYDTPARFCRSAFRFGRNPKYQDDTLGFRVVKGQ